MSAMARMSPAADLDRAGTAGGMSMVDTQWRRFFELGNQILGHGHADRARSVSWLSWTTYQRLLEDAGYWSAGLPALREVDRHRVGGGAVWRTPLFYRELAHVVVPRRFCRSGEDARQQDIDALSCALDHAGVDHEISAIALQIRRF